MLYSDLNQNILIIQIVSSLPDFNRKLRLQQSSKRGRASRRNLAGFNSTAKPTAKPIIIETAKLEGVVRKVTNVLVFTDQKTMVPGQPPSYVNGGDGITLLSSVSYPDDTISVCQPDKKLCALYPAGSIRCDGGPGTRVNFGVVGYKTSLNPTDKRVTASSNPGQANADLASEMYALKITTPGCKLVKPYSFTVQRSSFRDPREGAQCR